MVEVTILKAGDNRPRTHRDEPKVKWLDPVELSATREIGNRAHLAFLRVSVTNSRQ
jgi:hypothetical protein